MDLSSQIAEAQSFLDYYILGAGAAGTGPAFPGSQYRGIVLRRPAVLDVRPEYTPLPHPLDGTRVTPPNDGPEGPGDYTFLDRCAVRRAKVGSDGVVNFLFVPVYPAGRFSEVHPSVTPTVLAARPEEVRLPQSLNELNFTARECMLKLEDYLGFEDPEAAPNFGFSIQIMTLDEFNASGG